MYALRKVITAMLLALACTANAETITVLDADCTATDIDEKMLLEKLG